MIKSRIVVYTDLYKTGHNKSPRGYGDWHFSCKDKSGKKYEFNFEGMYKDAKIHAIEKACGYNSCVVNLLS